MSLNSILPSNEAQELQALVDSLSLEEREVALSIINQFQETGDSSILESLWSIDYERKPVGILEFMNDPYYLGNTFGKRLYPAWIPHLQNIFSPESRAIEIVLSGAIGIGKTNISIACMLYDLYKLLCLRNPQAYYGLTPNTRIVFALFNVTLTLAGNVGLQIWTDTIKESPYFREIATVNPRSVNSILFPKKIDILIGSRFSHSLGQAIYSALLDEANFGHTSAGMSKAASETSKSQVIESYTNIYQRMESRFKGVSGIPGHLYLVSSKRSQSDFLEDYVRKNKGKLTTYIVDEPRYKIKTQVYDEASDRIIPIYSSNETFRVLIGDQIIDSRILRDDEEPPAGYHVEEVPIDHLYSFESNVDDAIRNICGISLFSESSFVTNRDRFRRSINLERKNPVTKETCLLSFDGDDQVRDFILEDELKAGVEECSNSRAIHIDIGVSGDALGFAMSHINGIKKVKNIDMELKTVETNEYTYKVDLMLRLKYQDKDQLPLAKVARFIMYLKDELQVPIGFVSCDGYQSTYMLQLLRANYVETGVISVDRTADAYNLLRNVHYEERIDIPMHDIYNNEMFGLVKDNAKDKVDHGSSNPDGSKGSKDLADAVAGSVYSLTHNKAFQSQVNILKADQIIDMMEVIEKENRMAANAPQSLQQQLFGDAEDDEDEYY